MPFKRGKSGNPAGRPHGTFTQKKLEAAIAAFERKRKQEDPKLPTVMERFIEMAMIEPSVMTALMKKLIPDRKAIEGEIKGNGFSKVEVFLHKEDGSIVPLGAGSGDTNGESRS